MMLVQNEMNQSHESRSLDRVAKITIFCLDQGEGLNELARLDTSKLPLIAQPPHPPSSHRMQPQGLNFWIFLFHRRDLN